MYETSTQHSRNTGATRTQRLRNLLDTHATQFGRRGGRWCVCTCAPVNHGFRPKKRARLWVLPTYIYGDMCRA